MREELLGMAKKYLDNTPIEQLKQDLEDCWIEGPCYIQNTYCDDDCKCIIYWRSKVIK